MEQPVHFFNHQGEKLNRENTTLAVFPGADHMFSHKDHRQQVSKLVVEWFKKQLSE
ncbi:MAG: hypothetical protein JRF31_04340 [Deltaproteobacteria bacterium]|nr:hypothetical protein [Deltaproteobacteria bacterium]MBW1958858.1 hypothetical protein [Deltaproteobacteria bacterium]MBW2014072.1 hypothetical protein [Deltaproteobacteria bacterium]MBW2089422.1 hypothetical protein [Deltaproteobacteria bacterium]MBW2320075.1 hypothetical protein [Deltaproteobacteria bacterium]